MKTTPKVAVIMAGGTAGHVMPALCVANALRDQGYAVHWIGTERGIEARLVREANFPLHTLSVAGMRGKSFLHRLLTIPKLFIAFFQSIQLLSRLKPQFVLGFGGYTAGPGGVAAWLLQKPFMIHEQNASPGLTNRWLSHFSKKIFTAYPQAFSGNKKTVLVGNPVRTALLNLPEPEVRWKDRQGSLRILVLGGSLGARALNLTVPKALAQLSFPVDVWHQTGKYIDEARQVYEDSKVIPNQLTIFIDDMASAYQWADLVIARSGALTIAELTAVGLPAILVPYPHAVDDHQTKNALYLVEAGAAVLIPESKLSPEHLAAQITAWSDRQQCLTLAKKSRNLAGSEATSKIIATALTLVDSKSTLFRL